MPLISSFYGMYINSQDFSCLLENRPFLPKTLGVNMKCEPLKKVYYTNESGYELEYSKRYAAPFTKHFDMPIKEYHRKNTYSAFLIYTQEIALLMEQIYKSYEMLLYVIHSVPNVVSDQFTL